MKHFIPFLTCLTLTILMNAQTRIYVKPTGAGNGTSWADACSLDTAVKIAVSGDQIWVQRGTYYPTKMLVVPESVKVYGGFNGSENNLSQRHYVANPVIVDGQQKIGSVFRLENGSELNGFTIQNGNAGGAPHKNGGGIYADRNSIIANCTVINNVAKCNGGGIYAKENVEITNCAVKNNIAQMNGPDLFGNCVTLGAAEQSGTGCLGVDIAGCTPGVPYFGEIGFKTSTTWQVTDTAKHIAQEWSDVVMATGCNKTLYQGGATNNYLSDCRANSSRTLYGDLFSWCAVARFAHVLCPAPWRVPTNEDFADLDKAFGGNGDGTGTGATQDADGKYYVSAAIAAKYRAWGAAFGGQCNATGGLAYQGGYARFWAQSEYDANRGFHMHFGSANHIRPQGFFAKYLGFTVRCVR